MYIALRLLRDGAHTTITTRFPNDAVRRFSAMPDSADWLHRLRVVGIDLRDPGQVVALADEVAAQGPLDILINNAAQTVRRSPEAYAHLVAAEPAPLPAGRCREIVDARPRAASTGAATGTGARTPHALTALALTAGSASPERIADRHGDRRRRPGARPAPRTTAGARSSTRSTRVELLEVQLCNPTAPFILVSRLRAGAGGLAGPAHATSSTSRRWRASSAAATRARATRTPTWPRPR